jgi:OFA family oxalate/formate antiporter-like MFS transporter
MPAGSILAGKLGARLTMMLGSFILAAGVYLSSYVNSLTSFLMLYSVMGGAGIGLAYTAPMMAGWKWMPASKGFVSGAVLTGFGAGGFFFNLIGSKLVNPKGLNPVKGKFPVEVYDKFSPMLRNLACIYSLVALIGSLLVTEPTSKDTAAPAKGKAPVAAAVPGMGIMEARKTPQFWLLWTMIICSASAGLNVASVYKQFATSAPALAGDEFQSLVGGMGALFNGVGRLFWGSFSDKVGFKKAFGLLTIMQGVLHFLYPFSSQSKETFLAATCMCFFYLAGNFALMPPAIQRMYGPKNGALIYGIVYSAFAIASTGGLYLSKALLDQFGYSGIFRVMAVTSLFATALTFRLKPIANVPYSSV